MSDKQTYGYTPEFQVQIGALILRDQTFMREYEDIIDPTYFDIEELSSIVRIGREYILKYNDLPTRATLLQEIQDHCVRYHIDKAEVKSLVAYVEAIYADQIHALNGEVVRERVTRFGRRQSVRQGILKVVDLIETDGGLDQAADIMQDALRVGYATNTMGFDFYANAARLPEIAAANMTVSHCIKTLIPTLDEKTMGGPGRGEVWVMLGLSGHGKSQWLVSMGAAALKQNIPVLHVTVGDLDEDDVAFRYACNMTRCTQWDIIKNSEVFNQRVQKLAKHKNYLRIKYFDPGVPTVAHIRALISKIHTVDGIKPGMLIVDYPDEMKVEGDPYEGMGKIYSELKVLAKQYNMVCWVASQVHRWKATGEPNGDVLRMNNIADSARKVHKADGIISINQSVEENDSGFARLWCDKVRRGKREFKVCVEVDFAMSRIWQSKHLSFSDFKEQEAETKQAQAIQDKLEADRGE